MMNRRQFTGATAALAGLAAAPAVLWSRAAFADPREALATSRLVYLTPIKSNGEESRCQAEIWFAHHEGDAFVVTPPDAWRAEAVAAGLDRARLWIGDFGVWTESDGAYRQAPEIMATASLETDAEVHAQVLAAMGAKYADDGWERWGPRFKSGLADGARVMIRYRPDA